MKHVCKVLRLTARCALTKLSGMGWLTFRRVRRRRSPWNNVGSQGLTCGQVTDQLYVGGELGPRDWDALSKEGITVVVNLQQEQQDYFHDKERIESYLWLPAPDQLAPTIEQLALGVHFIRAALAAGKRVFVHCKAGQGRAPLLCACYLVSMGDTPMAAMSKVQEARPSTMLTPEQGTRLREFTAARDKAVSARQKQAAPVAPAAPAPEVPAKSEAERPVEEEVAAEAEETIEAVAEEVESIADTIEELEDVAPEADAAVTEETEPAIDEEAPVEHEPAVTTPQ